MNNELLVILPENNLEKCFQEGGLDPFIEKIRQLSAEFKPDPNTAKGRKEIKSFAYKIAQSKTYVDNHGKELVAEKKRHIKVTDQERKRWRDALDNLKIQVRQPLTNWEHTEEQRKTDIQDKINNIRSYDQNYNTSVEITDSLNVIRRIVIDDSFDEFQKEAEETLEMVIKNLDTQLKQLRIQEENEKTKKRLEKEKEIFAKQQTEIKLRKEAEEKAEKERLATEERERQLIEKVKKEADEKAQADLKKEKEKIRQMELKVKRAEWEKEQAVKQEKERAKFEAEQKQKEAEQREADYRHRKKINNEAMLCLIEEGIPDTTAKKVITIIAKRKIEHVSISY